MGQKIALQCARFGYEVVAYDAFPKSLENAQVKIPAFAAELVAQQKMTPEVSEAALSRISYTSRPEDGADADLLSESVKEGPRTQGENLCPVPSDLPAENGLHHQHVHAATVHVRGGHGPARPIRRAALPRRVRAQPGRRYAAPRDLPGNRGAPGGFRETNQAGTAGFQERVRRLRVERHLRGHEPVAIKIALIDKVMSVEDVDRAVMIHFQMPIGIFGMLDGIGLDTIWHVMESNAKISGAPGVQQFADEFKRLYIDKGWLGVKSGRGFYTSYPDPEFLRPEFLGGDPE